MHPSAESFASRVRDQYGFDPDIVEFEAETKTAADAAAAIGCDVSRIANSIVAVVEDTVVLAIVPGGSRVSLAALARRYDVAVDAVHVAAPETVKETLGWSVGGVPPLAHDTEVPTVVDPSVLAYETVWAGAGTPSAMVELDPDDLVAHTDAAIANVSADE